MVNLGGVGVIASMVHRVSHVSETTGEASCHMQSLSEPDLGRIYFENRRGDLPVDVVPVPRDTQGAKYDTTS